MTLREALAVARTRLSGRPELAATAGRDAEALLLHATGLARTTLLAYPERELSPQDRSLYEAAIARRLTCEPIQYILEQQEFYGLALRVTPAVLIPRPETEHLVEAVLLRLPHDQPVRILDIGTGSGAIAIALAVHLPLAQVVAVDISPGALAIASESARTHSVAERIQFVESDLLQALPGETFEAIVSNPPYIPTSDRSSLHPQVREYEPQLALFSGVTGLDLYRRIVPQAHAGLRPGGLLAMEIGWGQQVALADLLGEWSDLSFVKDLQDIPRVVLATRPA